LRQGKKVSSHKHVKLIVRGIVQGVGFRPFVYNLARSLNLRGYVNNTVDGVIIELQGELADHFIDLLTKRPPPLSDISSVDIIPVEEPDRVFDDFNILESADGKGFTLTSPDVSVCDDCLTEMMNPGDRRYLYPFINCTNCGPRYTITEKVPYDRNNTTMKVFTMCNNCQAEYDDPGNRRFHAQPNACPACGPSLSFEPSGNSVRDGNLTPLAQALAYLQEGKVVAIKGLGGFNIACNALDEQAVARLRREKRKSNKPFALMSPDNETIEKYCFVSDEERELLNSPRRPIVLLKKRQGIEMPEAVAPGMNYLGFMLPYTPLHYLLFKYCEFKGRLPECLIMTSGNLSEEPIVIDNEIAKEVLSDVADGFLLHNRDIFMRNDDSVTALLAEEDASMYSIHYIRRARGFVPDVIPLESEGPEVIGVGADLKNTFTLTKGKYAIPSQHIGDMENYETVSFFEETYHNLTSVYRVTPVAAGYDMHPGYLSTKWALERKDMKLIPVQHHHAHVASVMACHGLNENVIGVIMDGTGYGPDGNLWGGEFLISNALNFKRMAHFKYVPLIGGESSIRNPWKIALSFIKDAYGRDTSDYLAKIGFMERYGLNNVNNVLALSENEDFCALSSGAGRVFDAVSALLGICDENTFEGEAPMKLEATVKEGIVDDYPVDIVFREPMEIDFSMMFISMITDLLNGVRKEIISTRFHNTIISIILKMVTRLKENLFIHKVVLSGGTFQNRYLIAKCIKYLEGEGLEVFINNKIPCNDAGISLGQAYIAREKIKKGII
jgi:hydrogenase maturation protein HypF